MALPVEPAEATRVLAETLDYAALSLLAVLQGLTEFLPISSSGHLVLAQVAMGLTEPALALDVALHLGTLAAVGIVYRRDLLEVVSELLRGDLRQTLALVVGTIPAGLVGVLGREALSEAFHSTRMVGVGLLVTGAALLFGEVVRGRRYGTESAETPPPEDGSRVPSLGAAFLIGCAQALAILPGISRSGSTIVAGMALGLRPAHAARFSFLLAIPAILGAAVLNLPGALEGELAGGAVPVLWAAILAGMVGWAALRVLLAFLGRGAFRWFAAYCGVLGLGLLVSLA